MKCVLCENNYFETLSNKVRNDLPIKVVKCKKCSLVSLENPIKNAVDYSDEEYRKLHSPVIGKELTPKEMFDFELQFQKQRIKHIQSLLKSTYRILEIGSSTGHFLFSIKDMVNEVIGIELNQSHAKFSRDHCKLKVYDIPLGDAPLEEEYFDVIFLFQVFEHIPNPLEFLCLAKKFLKPNGKICVEVPNINEALLQVYKIPSFPEFYYRQPHSYYYSKETLLKIMNKAGFSGEIIFQQDYSIFNHIHWLLSGKPQLSKELGYKIPLKQNDSKEHEIVLKKFFETINEDYKKLLEENGLSENICFIGSLS